MSDHEKTMEISIDAVRRGRPTKVQVDAEMSAANKSSEEVVRVAEKVAKVICELCKRRFPRLKSLTAHIRIHTGFCPYECTYPLCKRAFKQSGQLKMHAKTHTGEKDYRCPVEDCKVRFTHPNRRCRDHPDAKIKRDGKGQIQYNENQTEAEREWLDNYKLTKGKSAKRKKPADECSSNSDDQSQSIWTIPIENSSDSSQQSGILCNIENAQDMGNNLLSVNDSKKKNKSAKRRKTLNVTKVEAVGLSSSDGSSSSSGLSAQTSALFNQVSFKQHTVSYDSVSICSDYLPQRSIQNISSNYLPHNSLKGQNYTSVVTRAETLNQGLHGFRGECSVNQILQRAESSAIFETSSVNSLHVEQARLIPDPIPIRTSVIQSSQRSRNAQNQLVDADTLDTAMASQRSRNAQNQLVDATTLDTAMASQGSRNSQNQLVDAATLDTAMASQGSRNAQNQLVDAGTLDTAMTSQRSRNAQNHLVDAGTLDTAMAPQGSRNDQNQQVDADTLDTALTLLGMRSSSNVYYDRAM